MERQAQVETVRQVMLVRLVMGEMWVMLGREVCEEEMEEEGRPAPYHYPGSFRFLKVVKVEEDLEFSLCFWSHRLPGRGPQAAHVF